MSNSDVVLHMVVIRLEKLLTSEWEQLDSAGRFEALEEIKELGKGVYDGPVLNDDDLYMIREALIGWGGEYRPDLDSFLDSLIEKIEAMRNAL